MHKIYLRGSVTGFICASSLCYLNKILWDSVGRAFRVLARIFSKQKRQRSYARGLVWPLLVGESQSLPILDKSAFRLRRVVMALQSCGSASVLHLPGGS